MVRQFDTDDRCIHCGLLKLEHQRIKLNPTDWWDSWRCPDPLSVERRGSEDPWNPVDVGEAPVSALFDPVNV